MTAIIRFKPIARDLDLYRPKDLQRAIVEGLAEIGPVIEKQFQATVQTWNVGGTDGKPVTGGIPKFRRFGPIEVYGNLTLEVSTNSAIYYYLNFGTRAHQIRARRAKVLSFRSRGVGSYRPKTRQGYLGSTGGGPTGPWIARRQVAHPGNFARGWDITITEATASRGMLTKMVNERIRASLGSLAGGVRSVRS